MLYWNHETHQYYYRLRAHRGFVGVGITADRPSRIFLGSEIVTAYPAHGFIGYVQCIGRTFFMRALGGACACCAFH